MQLCIACNIYMSQKWKTFHREIIMAEVKLVKWAMKEGLNDFMQGIEESGEKKQNNNNNNNKLRFFKIKSAVTSSFY